MEANYDVAVIGAGTAGILFARRMAEQGCSVAVFDKLSEERQGERLGVFHTDLEHFEPYGVPIPQPGDEDWVGRFDYGITKSAFDHYPKRADYPFLILKFKPFLKRLRNWAAETGKVSFFFGAKFDDFIRDGDENINGAVINIGGTQHNVSARLVADCSGIPSVARRKLKNSRVETFEITPRDMFYVILHYVKLKNPGQPFPADVPLGEQYPDGQIAYPTGYAQYKAWVGGTEDPGCFLFGTGANLSFEYAMKCHEEFRNAIKAPPYEEYEGYGEGGRWEKGVTPYHRAPYSMVDGGFICLGDTACMTKPFSGEGVSSGWVGVKLAAEVCGKAMRGGAYPTEAALWEFNTRYAATQGADFANITATLVNAVDCTAEENEYEFKKGIVFTGKLLTLTNRTFSADIPLSDALALVGKMIVGGVTGNISFNSLRNLIKGVMCGGSLKSHYKKFPKTTAGYDAWCAKADKLWEKTGNMADVVERAEARKAGANN
ncbi:MAG: FAD-dependent monooxygenase [Oscillospiraceae bacterium]|jgi:flavin-dependent dehydrogenase|nr:FAD-dependent monooxygenase [Oscillospiraceae bacterium]